MKLIKQVVAAAAFAFTAMALPLSAAHAYPTKTVRIVLPFPPGGSADTVARLLAEELNKRMGGPFVVENKPGASANLGTGYVAKAEPDGHTLLFGVTGAMSINPWLYSNLDYVPEKDFQAISMIATAPVVVVASPQSGIDSIQKLVSTAKSEPNKLAYATNGIGTSHQLSAELFSRVAGIQIRNVPYKGTPAALQDIAGGRVELGFVDFTASLPLIADERVKALATTGAERPSALANVPTVKEAGYPDYESLTWIALFAPKGMNMDDVKTLNKHVNDVLAEPAIREKALGYGLQLQGSTPKELHEFLVSENQKWSKVVKEAGIKLN